MQTVSEIEIRNEDKRDKVASTIADKYCRHILKLIIDRPKSVLEISRETKISISSVS